MKSTDSGRSGRFHNADGPTTGQVTDRSTDRLYQIVLTHCRWMGSSKLPTNCLIMATAEP